MSNAQTFSRTQTLAFPSPDTLTEYYLGIYDVTDTEIPPPHVTTGFGRSIFPAMNVASAAFTMTSEPISILAGLYKFRWYLRPDIHPIAQYTEYLAATYTDVTSFYKELTGVDDKQLVNRLSNLIYRLQVILPCFNYSDFDNIFEQKNLDEGLVLLLRSEEAGIDTTSANTPLIGYSQGDTVYKYAQPLSKNFSKRTDKALRDRAIENLRLIPCFDDYFSKGNTFSLQPTSNGLNWCQDA